MPSMMARSVSFDSLFEIRAAMGLLSDDETLIDAALSEIVGLPMEEQLRRDPGRDVESLLVNHYLAEV